MRPIDADELRKTAPMWLDGTVLVMPVSALDDAPTIEAEPVTAEWIMDEIERDPIIQHGRVYRNYSTTFRCSKCNTTFAGSNLYFNYCPYCGKKMINI